MQTCNNRRPTMGRTLDLGCGLKLRGVDGWERWASRSPGRPALPSSKRTSPWSRSLSRTTISIGCLNTASSNTSRCACTWVPRRSRQDHLRNDQPFQRGGSRTRRRRDLRHVDATPATGLRSIAIPPTSRVWTEQTWDYLARPGSMVPIGASPPAAGRLRSGPEGVAKGRICTWSC